MGCCDNIKEFYKMGDKEQEETIKKNGKGG